MTEDEIYERSNETIRKAMKDVLAEFLIKLPDGTDHIVYIQKFKMNGNRIEFDFSTFDETRKDELTPHIENIFVQLYEQEMESRPSIRPKPKKKLFGLPLF